ncbi:MAG: 50S ribosomal protein L29 [Candidatus Woesearchaeota archaeon]
MKMSDLKNMSQEELKEKLVSLRKELVKAKVQIMTNQNKMIIRNLKKDIARILTVLNSKTQ